MFWTPDPNTVIHTHCMNKSHTYSGTVYILPSHTQTATHPVPALRHGCTVTGHSADEEEEEVGADGQTSSQASPVLRD